MTATTGLPWTEEAVENLTARQVLTKWVTNPRNLGQVLEADWTWFLMSSFRHAIPRHHALTAGQRFVKWCSAWRSFQGGRDVKAFRLLLWSAESHMTGDVHVHALSVTTPLVSGTHCLKCAPRISSCRHDYQALKESHWYHVGKMYARPYDPRLMNGAEAYVTKYVLKETCLDWGIEEW